MVRQSLAPASCDHHEEIDAKPAPLLLILSPSKDEDGTPPVQSSWFDGLTMRNSGMR
jgi:hypothetical protein